MKIVLKRLKIFGLAFTIASSSAISLSGCSNSNNNNYYEDYEVSNNSQPITLDSNSTAIVTDDDIIFEIESTEEVNENDITENYVKDENNVYLDVTLEDIIITLDERKITVDDVEKDYHTNLVGNMYSYWEYLPQNQSLEYLNVEKYFEQVFTSDIATTQNTIHESDELYDYNNDDILWDKVFDVVKDNNRFKKQEEDNNEFSSKKLEELDDSDLQFIIGRLNSFVDLIKIDNPDLDMKQLACHLSELTIFYNHYSLQPASVYNHNMILFGLSDGCYPDFTKFDPISFHEFKHFICGPCEQKEDSFVSLSSTGFEMDVYGYAPFRWKFIEEATAESYASSLLEKDPVTYGSSRYVLDTLEMVNSFSGTEIGSLCKSSILHNPISLIQQFLVLGDDERKTNKWLLNNAIMLECYDVLEFRDVEFLYHIEDEIVRKSAITSCKETASLHTLRLGITGLSIINSNKKLTLDDHFYLVKLLEYRIEQYNLYLKNRFETDSSNTDAYYDMYFNILNLYFEYLENEYGVTDAYKKYQDFNFNNYTLSDVFTEEEKKYYNDLNEKVYQIEDYNTQINEYLSPFYKSLGIR